MVGGIAGGVGGALLLLVLIVVVLMLLRRRQKEPKRHASTSQRGKNEEPTIRLSFSTPLYSNPMFGDASATFLGDASTAAGIMSVSNYENATAETSLPFYSVPTVYYDEPAATAAYSNVIPGQMPTESAGYATFRSPTLSAPPPGSTTGYQNFGSPSGTYAQLRSNSVVSSAVGSEYSFLSPGAMGPGDGYQHVSLDSEHAIAPEYARLHRDNAVTTGNEYSALADVNPHHYIDTSGNWDAGNSLAPVALESYGPTDDKGIPLGFVAVGC